MRAAGLSGQANDPVDDLPNAEYRQHWTTRSVREFRDSQQFSAASLRL